MELSVGDAAQRFCCRQFAWCIADHESHLPIHSLELLQFSIHLLVAHQPRAPSDPDGAWVQIFSILSVAEEFANTLDASAV